MNDLELDQFESELRELRPSPMPRPTRERLLASLPSRPSPKSGPSGWHDYLRWLVPATAVAALMLLVLSHIALFQSAKPRLASAGPPLKADKVEIDRELLARFDAVGHLPDGRALRFRCAQWRDNVRLSDSAAGLLIERSSPRLEIVPVGFETE
jgi:hypothetical protein